MRNSEVITVFFSTFDTGFKSHRLRHIASLLPNSKFFVLRSSQNIPGVVSSMTTNILLYILKKIGLPLYICRSICEQYFYLVALIYIAKNRNVRIVICQARSPIFIFLLDKFGYTILSEIAEPLPYLWHGNFNDYFGIKINKLLNHFALTLTTCTYSFNEHTCKDPFLSGKLNFYIPPLPEIKKIGYQIKKNSSRAKVLFVYIGPISQRKGILEILSRENMFNNHVKIGVIGVSGADKESLQANANVTEIFQYSQSPIDDLVNLANRYKVVGIVPSNFEGFPRVFWDFKALSLPVIGFKQVLGDYADFGVTSYDEFIKIMNNCSNNLAPIESDVDIEACITSFNEKFVSMIRSVSTFKK